MSTATNIHNGIPSLALKTCIFVLQPELQIGMYIFGPKIKALLHSVEALNFWETPTFRGKLILPNLVRLVATLDALLVNLCNKPHYDHNFSSQMLEMKSHGLTCFAIIEGNKW